MKRRMLALSVMLLVILLLPLSVSANAPPDRDLGEYNNILGAALLKFVLLPIVMTILSEWMIAMFFRIGWHYSKVIICTNLISQLIMWIVYILFLILSPLIPSKIISDYYIFVLLVLEIPIYICEYTVYRGKIPELSKKKCLLYTITANTVSLTLGLLWNAINFSL